MGGGGRPYRGGFVEVAVQGGAPQAACAVGREPGLPTRRRTCVSQSRSGAPDQASRGSERRSAPARYGDGRAQGDSSAAQSGAGAKAESSLSKSSSAASSRSRTRGPTPRPPLCSGGVGRGLDLAADLRNLPGPGLKHAEVVKHLDHPLRIAAHGEGFTIQHDTATDSVDDAVGYHVVTNSSTVAPAAKFSYSA